MSLLFEGLRRKKNSWTPEYRLTREIFDLRKQPSIRHEYKAGFEVDPEKLCHVKTLQEAVDHKDWFFLDTLLQRFDDVDLSDLQFPAPHLIVNDVDLFDVIYTWQLWQRQDRHNRRMWRDTLLSGALVITLCGMILRHTSWLYKFVQMGFVLTSLGMNAYGVKLLCPTNPFTSYMHLRRVILRYS